MHVLLSVGGLAKTFSLEDQIIFAKQAGFDGIDYILTLSDMFFTPHTIITLSRKHAMPIKSLHIPLPFVLYMPPLIDRNIAGVFRHFPDVTLFNFHLSGFMTPLLQHENYLLQFQKMITKKGIAVSCESNPNTFFILNPYPKVTTDPDLFAEFCIKRNIPINLDTSHISSWNYDISLFFNKYHSFINLIHLSDMLPGKQHLPLGKGNLPLGELFKAMKKHRYNGTVIFEIFNFPKDVSKQEMKEEIARNIMLFKKSVR